jgi:hypothetical protein
MCRQNISRQLDKKIAERDNMKHEVEKIQQHDRLLRDVRLLRCRAAQLEEARTQVHPSLHILVSDFINIVDVPPLFSEAPYGSALPASSMGQHNTAPSRVHHS